LIVEGGLRARFSFVPLSNDFESTRFKVSFVTSWLTPLRYDVRFLNLQSLP
jgi:hypothetical protein